MLQQVHTEGTQAGHATKLLLAKMPRNLGTLAGFFVAHGKDSSLYEHTKKEAGKYKADLSHVEAVQLLAAKLKLSKNVRQAKNAAKLARNEKVKTSVSMSLS